MQRLFSYGTLQFPQVQESLFGRLLEGQREELPGYRVENLKITEQEVIQKSGTNLHPILVKTDNPMDSVEGMVLKSPKRNWLRRTSTKWTTMLELWQTCRRGLRLGFMRPLEFKPRYPHESHGIRCKFLS